MQGKRHVLMIDKPHAVKDLLEEISAGVEFDAGQPTPAPNAEKSGGR